MARFLLSLVFLFLLGTVESSWSKEVYMQTRIYYDSAEELNQLKMMNLDVVMEQDNFLEIVVFPDELEKVRDLGFTADVIHEDMTAFFQSRLDPSRNMGGYKTLSEINAYLDAMIADHPNIVSNKVDIGLSLEGRTMWACKISDNPNADEDEAELLYTAAIHAREVITPEVLLYFMDYLTNNYGADPEATFLVDNREMWFILVINVDGYYHNEFISPQGGGMWRKNRRNNGDGSYGIDLNRNWGYMWGYNDIGSSPDGNSELFRGTGPFSEPETQNVSNFIASRNFVIVTDYHSYTNAIYRPWGYNGQTTPDEDLLVALTDSMRVYNGYIHSTMGINGCSSDWEYGEQSIKNKNLAFLFEVGSQDDNFWPPLDRIPYLVEENLEPNKLLAYFAGDPLSIYPPLAPELTIPETVSAVEYNVEWTFNDPYNEPEQYELVEFLLGENIVEPCLSLEYYENVGFTVSSGQFHSAPTSYYSGAFSNSIRYFQDGKQTDISQGDILEFWTYYDIQERYDYAYVEVSTDGLVFTPIPGNITTNYNPNGLNRGNGITGTSSGWVQGLFNLSAYAGQSIFIRFSYYTDAAYVGDGIYIDDIYPANGFVNETLISSNITDNFYTFVDKPAGVYYYKVKAMDAENQWSDYSDMAATTVVRPYVCGDADGNEEVNILDIVYLINYKYKGGFAPEPMEAGDADGIPPVNILDIVYLINYKYKSGPEPLCP